jgi:Glycosyl hydrolases family 35
MRPMQQHALTCSRRLSYFHGRVSLPQYGGIPLWLRENKQTVFRTNDTTWKYEMANFVSVVMKYVQPYLARSGGPIILAQIENEFDYAEDGKPGSIEYVKWCGQLAESYDSGLVWGMCQSHGISAVHNS